MNDEDAPRLIEHVHDVAWFEKMLAQSRETLAALPPGAQPSWFREYMEQRRETSDE